MVSGFHLSCRDDFFVINHILFNAYSNLKSAVVEWIFSSNIEINRN